MTDLVERLNGAIKARDDFPPQVAEEKRFFTEILDEIEHMQAVIDRVALIRLDLESENRRLTAEGAELRKAAEDAFNMIHDDPSEARRLLFRALRLDSASDGRKIPWADESGHTQSSTLYGTSAADRQSDD